MTRERDALLAHLEAQRAHVLASVDGLGEEDLTRAVVPSGWSFARMLNHLAYDDEVFWGGAVVAGDAKCIGLVRVGWQEPVTSAADARAGVLRLLVETATHGGHLDLARESIDGHQHLVVSGDG